MLEYLKNLLQKKEPGDDARVQTSQNKDGAVIVSDLGLVNDLIASGEISIFQGDIDYGYSLSTVRSSDECPRCGAATRLEYANFIYQTQTRPRLLTAPAGYFCTKCKTVIVDEKLLRKGVTPGFEYRGVVGLDYMDKKPPDLFSKWNDKRNLIEMDLRDESSISAGASPVQWERIKRKKKMAKASRKRNRRK